MTRALLEITDLLTFLVCKSSTNGPQKQEAEVSIHADGLCVSYQLTINDVLLRAKTSHQSLVSK